MRMTFATLTLLATMSTYCLAEEKADLRKLVDDPGAYVSKRIRVASISCVDDPKGGYVCMRTVGGQILRIQAEALGAGTEMGIAERLLGDCKGTANLQRTACRVDAEIEPSSGKRDVMDTPGGSMPVTIVEAVDIEMYAIASPRRNRDVQLPSGSASRRAP